MRRTRRAVLAGLGGLGLAGLAGVPGRIAAEGASDRKFLFIFASGGWDPTFVFAPKLGAGMYDPPGSTAVEIGGIPLVDAADRPSVRRFFEQNAHRTALINGMEVRSVTHERCRRILLTGSSAEVSDDWPARLAAAAPGYRLPHLVLSGPSYSDRYTASVMRVGANGQIAGLIDGSALTAYEPAVSPFSPGSEAAMRAFTRARLDAARAEVAADPLRAGQPPQFLADWATALDQRSLVDGLGEELAVSAGSGGYQPATTRIQPALNSLQAGYSRCAILEHAGLYDLGWDTHSGIGYQATHFETLFADLLGILGELDRRTDPLGQPLSATTTVVLLSEMGRAPGLNTTGGKDHWTFTSAMLLGAGVRGGTVAGALDDHLVGQPTDLLTGQPDSGGDLLTAAHLGATLLALAGLDPAEAGADPVEAVLA